MTQLRGSTYQLLLFVLAVFAFSIFFATFPVKAFGLEATSQTNQVLPPGGNACAAVSVTNFVPYIYDGALHSFEFTVPDASYVAVLGSVGNTQLPFNLMTRRVDSSGALRVHVDVQTTPIVGTLPLKITLLSARSGNPVCMTVVSAGVGSGPVAIQNIPSAHTVPTTVSVAPATPTAPSAPTAPAAPQKPRSPDPVPTTQKVLTTSTSEGSVVGSAFANLCSSEASAYRLWLILLVLYMLIVGAALWAEFPMSVAWARTPERIATIILALLLVLLAFWYFSISCRAALWMPLMAFLIAVLGLLAAFWNHPRVTQMLLIQEAKQTPEPAKSSSATIVTSQTKTTSTTIITPPAKTIVPPAKK